jgi:hypothetical protein
MQATSVPSPRPWTRATLQREEWLRPFPRRCLDELEKTAQILERNPLHTYLLDPRDYPLEQTRGFMAEAKAVLDRGCGFVVLGRLPVRELGRERSKDLYWLLSSLIARPVAQAFKGTMLYDVRDLGLAQSAEVRGDVTREELNWHTDYGYNCPAPYVGLQVLRVARTGGVSSVASLATLRAELERRHPRLLRRLYEPFVWNRALEHPADEPRTRDLAVFHEVDGEPRARFNPFMIVHGHRLAERPLDALGQQALDTVWDILGEHEMHTDFELEPGQIQYLANYHVAHRRTTYEDFDDDEEKRHLVRIFLRDSGQRSFDG